MHSCVYVLIGPDTDIEMLVAQAIGPFSEQRTVPPYKLHLPSSGARAIAQHYGLPETDLQAVAAQLPDWMGYAGGVDELGVFALVDRNPDAKWDWYEIGGRWNGYITGHRRRRERSATGLARHNCIAAAELLAAPDFADRLPHALVTPTGDWVERSTFVATSSGWYWREESDEAWRQRVRRILAAFPDHRVVAVDAHS